MASNSVFSFSSTSSCTARSRALLELASFMASSMEMSLDSLQMAEAMLTSVTGRQAWHGTNGVGRVDVLGSGMNSWTVIVSFILTEGRLVLGWAVVGDDGRVGLSFSDILELSEIVLRDSFNSSSRSEVGLVGVEDRSWGDDLSILRARLALWAFDRASFSNSAFSSLVMARLSSGVVTSGTLAGRT